MRVSVIIVSYNTCGLLRRCLGSLEPQHEVIVVDNASQDGSLEMVVAEFPRARLLRNKKNLGFGAANNRGSEAATGELVLFLNSDAYACPGSIGLLADHMQDSGVVACGGRLVTPGSEQDFDQSGFLAKLAGKHAQEGYRLWAEHTLKATQQSCCARLTLWAVFCEQTGLEKVLPRSRWFSPYWQTHRLVSGGLPGPYEVEQVMGACLMVRRGARFDERFFLYCEDTDLCRRLRAQGRILYVPDALFGHELGASSVTHRWLSVARYNRGKELYFAIHVGPFASHCCFALNRMGALLRCVMWSVLTVLSLGRTRSKAMLFWRVLTSPINGPYTP